MSDLLVRLAFPVLVLAFSLMYWFSIRDLPVFARGFPQLILVLLAIFVVVSLVKELREWFGNRRATSAVDEETSSKVSPQEPEMALVERASMVAVLTRPWAKTITMLVLLSAMVVGINLLGWYTSIFLFFLSSFLYLRVRIFPTMVILIPSLMALLYFLFDVLLNLRLPPTPLP